MVIAVCLMETPAECICCIEVLRLSAFVIHLDSNCVSLQEVQMQSFILVSLYRTMNTYLYTGRSSPP